MTLLEAIRDFIRTHPAPAHSLQDLYAGLPDIKRHSLRSQIYKNLGSCFQRVAKGVYVAVEKEATCVVVEADAWEAVKDIESRSVDALITDPPYPWLSEILEIHTVTRRRMRWGFEKREIDRELGFELYRVLKEGAHAFFFVPSETKSTRPHIDRFIGMLEGCGFIFNKRFIWDRLRMGMGYNGRCRYEGILFMSRGKRRMPCDFSVCDVIPMKAVDPRVRLHPTAKPVGLLERLVAFSTETGELILDCFAGALSTGRAALNLGRNAILIEKSAAVLERALSGT